MRYCSLCVRTLSQRNGKHPVCAPVLVPGFPLGFNERCSARVSSICCVCSISSDDSAAATDRFNQIVAVICKDARRAWPLFVSATNEWIVFERERLAAIGQRNACQAILIHQILGKRPHHSVINTRTANITKDHTRIARLSERSGMSATGKKTATRTEAKSWLVRFAPMWPMVNIPPNHSVKTYARADSKLE